MKYYMIAVLFCMAFISASTQNMKNAKVLSPKNIGIQLYSVRDDIQKDFKGTIQAVANAGYKSIEAANYSDGKFYGLSPAAFKTAIESVGMEVLSSHTSKALPEDVSAANWDEIWKWWDACIQAHKAAGMKYLVNPWMPAPKTISELQAYCDYFNQIGERCKKAGLKFGYHNHNFEFKEVEGQIIYDYMLQHTDPSKVFFEMDVYWTMRGGQSPVEYFQKYPGRFKLLHIKDHKELGQSGMMGFDAIFRNLDKAGTERLIVEVENYTYSPLVSIKKSMDYLLNSHLLEK